MFLWGVVRYRDYALALITYGQVDDRSRGMTAALVQEDGVWKRTNALSGDETMDMVWSAFRVGEMVARSEAGSASGEGFSGELGDSYGTTFEYGHIGCRGLEARDRVL